MQHASCVMEFCERDMCSDMRHPVSGLPLVKSTTPQGLVVTMQHAHHPDGEGSMLGGGQVSATITPTTQPLLIGLAYDIRRSCRFAMHPCHKNPRTGRLSNQDWLQRACVPERGNHTRQATPQRGLANHWTHQGSICTALAWGLVDQFTQHATPLVVWHTPGFSTGQGLCFELPSRILHDCPRH